MNRQYVYLTSNQGDGLHLYTVGFYKPDGTFESESDHDTVEGAEDQVSFLNGGATKGLQDAYKKVSVQNQELRNQIAVSQAIVKNNHHDL